MNDYSFGNFIYTLRTEKGLSQSQLGEMLGVTNKSVSKWENGSAKPNTNLIPRIAEIFGVTVEELFACKRFEKDSEYENIKNYLAAQKKKNAVLYSAFLSAIIILPLLMIEFIFVVTGFNLSDDTGALGAMGFIFAFIVSITSFIIYRRNFRQALTPSESTYTPRFAEIVKKGLLISAIVWWCGFVLLFTAYFLILLFSDSFISAYIFLSIAIFVLILLLGVFICLANIKRILKIKFSKLPHKEKKKIPFSELPIWVKICHIASIVLYPIVLNILIWGHNGRSIIKFAFVIIWFACAFAVIFYNLKKKK